jgi:hypothetical protein
MSAEDAAYAHDAWFFPPMPKLRSCTEESRRAVGPPVSVTMPCHSYGQHLVQYVNSVLYQLRFKLSPGDDLNAKER